MASLCILAACGAPKPADAPSPALAAPTATPTPTPTPTSTPPPTGGSVLLGDIAAPKGFDPKPALVAFEPQLLSCYNQARASNASLHGKLRLRIQISEAGSVLSVAAEAGGSANDPALVACIGEAMGGAGRFPKPSGTATVVAPLVFRP
jgi:hypothetical protein